MIGNLLSRTLKSSYHKSHHFDCKDDVLIASGDRRAQPRLPSLKYESKSGARAYKLGIPDWITFNNQILRFSAVSFDKRGSSSLLKPFFYSILYFLEDDSIQVVEKCRSDDLKFQGAHLKRHQIPKTGLYTDDDDYYRIDDFNIHKDVIMYNKKYRIYDCDRFTRDYLTSLGVEVPDRDEELCRLQQLHLEIRDTTMRRPVSCPNYRVPKKPLRQFLEYDGKVLTFQCLRLKQRQPYDKLLLLYYLSDDKIEIRESDPTVNYPQLGRPPPPRSKILVHRSKIPKQKKLSPLPDDDTGIEYFTDKDLAIGSKIDIWGRVLFIYDCDDFTKRFFNLKYGIEVKAIPLEEIGIATEDQPSQSRRRSQSALPSFRNKKLPYQPQFVKFIKYGTTANDSHILRFRAKFCTAKSKSSDDRRHLIISYHLVDDTVTVYEKPERNTGYSGGVIIQRCKISDQSTPAGRPLSLSDFYVGATLRLNGQWFQLTDADEYTLNYMENQTDEFPTSHRLSVLAKLKRITNGNVRDLKTLFAERDHCNAGQLDEKTFNNVLREMRLEDENLLEQEIITLKRSYADSKQREPSLYIDPIYAIQNELRSQHFTEFDHLKSYLKSRDFTKCGFMSAETIARHCLAYPLPVKKFITDQALKTIDSTDEGVDYEQFVNAINWRLNPAPIDHYNINPNAKSAMVDYKRLIKDMEELELEST